MYSSVCLCMIGFQVLFLTGYQHILTFLLCLCLVSTSSLQYEISKVEGNSSLLASFQGGRENLLSQHHCPYKNSDLIPEAKSLQLTKKHNITYNSVHKE